MSDSEQEEDKSRSRKSSRRERSRSGSREKKRSRRSRSGSRDRSRRGSSRSRDRDRRSSRRRSRSRTPEETEEEKARKQQEAEREANRDEYTVFVAQIHPKVDDRDLFEFFSHVGRVEDIRLIRDQRTQKSKGLAYIEFWEKDSVGKAVTLTGQLLGGYPITISITESDRQSVPQGDKSGDTSMRLYVGQLHENVTDSDLKPVFEAFGEIDFIDLHKDAATGKSKGFGFVQYKSETDARAALEALNGLEIAGKNIKVGIVDSTNDQKPGELDEEGTGGMALNAASRAALMQKLGRGAVMPMFPGMDATAAPVAANTGVMTAASLNVPRIQPTACVIVKNMFDPKTETEVDFDLDIKEDVEEEATKFGKVKHIFVDKNSVGFVYVRYEEIGGAEKLVNAFNGRWFASRQISAEFVPPLIYTSKFPQSK